jgi:outer membrane immunogenic protein
MKKLASAIAAIALIGTPAFAADIAVKAPPAPPPVPVFSWTGFYVGGDVGAKWMQDEWTVTSLFDGGGPAPGFVGAPGAPTTTYTVSGIRAGGFVGYNWQFSPTWVGGVEGDAAWADNSQTESGFPGCTASSVPGYTCVAGATTTPNGLPFGGDTTIVKMLWDASARVRLGYLVGPDSLYLCDWRCSLATY